MWANSGRPGSDTDGPSPRKPIRQIFPDCCAPAPRGAASTAPRPVTKARRFIVACGPQRSLASVEDRSNRLQQLPHADRLTLEAVEARGHDAFLVVGHYRRRDGNDRDSASNGIGAKLVKCFLPGDSRQVNIHQDESGVLLTRQLHAVFTRPGLDRSVTPDLKDVAHKLQVLR